jgi:hypothetical protein
MRRKSGCPLSTAALFALALAATLAAPARAGDLLQGPKLVVSGPIGAIAQGSSVAISPDGGTVIVGAPWAESLKGAAWTFARSGGAWIQGGELVGTGENGQPLLGHSVAISDEGTAVVGGPSDRSDSVTLTGAAWVFTRSGGMWTQQGPKLVGSASVQDAGQGFSVAISADGNTVLVGAPNDGGAPTPQGAVWVFTRSAGVWTQQGLKLGGQDRVGNARQGYSVALSADGNTALFGGDEDDSSTGAAWVFVRTAGIWSQQGPKLVGTGAVGGAGQGASVALSPDGNTAIVGGPYDNANVGAAWVFTRSNGTWTQQGEKLVGTVGSGQSDQGWSVALSSQGATALVGGIGDHTFTGAVWVFERAGAGWAQKGGKLLGLGEVGEGRLGQSVALSRDGTAAIVGGLYDDANIGASWIFMRLCSRGDVNGDGVVDISDVFYFINFLFAGGPAPRCF